VSAAERPLDAWLSDLETRYLADLTFAEVTRALRALSSAYVERRGRLREGTALSGAGKRAAFALFYGPLHFLLIEHIARTLGARGRFKQLLDLGCGTGVAGAAWVSGAGRAIEVEASDRHPWAADEARHTYRHFGIRARVRVQDIARAPLPPRSLVVLAFAVNELPSDARDALRERLLAHGQSGAVLIVEPLAGFVAPWWADWQRAFAAAGGEAREWRVRAELPPIVAKLDRAAGMNHREITGRSLWLSSARPEAES
jgi:SAM-dependent methyltransferase